MTVRLILDTSAVLAYIKGSIHVGELITELQDEADIRFAVPVLCLAEAGTVSDDGDTLVLLARHGRATVTSVPADRWLDLVNLSKMLGRVNHAATFMTATKHQAYLVTATPERYPDTDMIIEIGN
jgi:PIN domain nuclease of toxin-antitoxin system